MSRRLSVVFALVIVLALSACASSRIAKDASAIRAARGELSSVKYAMNYFRHRDVWDSFPAPARITSHEDLISVVGRYALIYPEEMADWTFVSYERPQPNWFILKVRVHDKEGTLFEVTSARITPVKP